MQPKDLLQTDLDFTKKKLEQNFSNYSAWHQRSKLLPHLLSDANEDERKRLIDEGNSTLHGRHWAIELLQDSFFFH